MLIGREFMQLLQLENSPNLLRCLITDLLLCIETNLHKQKNTNSNSAKFYTSCFGKHFYYELLVFY